MPRILRHHPELDSDSNEHAALWAAHVAAGRIGTPTTLSPRAAATLAANDALFRARATRLKGFAR